MTKKSNALILFLALGASLVAQNDYDSSIRVEKLLQTDTTVVGQAFSFQQLGGNEVVMSKVIIPPGASTQWHMHARSVFGYILKGTLTVEYENGRINHFKAGDTFAEAIEWYHNGKNTGNVDLEMVAVYLSKKGEPLTIMKEK